MQNFKAKSVAAYPTGWPLESRRLAAFPYLKKGFVSFVGFVTK